jgi:hypothetical protein
MLPSVGSSLAIVSEECHVVARLGQPLGCGPQGRRLRTLSQKTPEGGVRGGQLRGEQLQ